MYVCVYDVSSCSSFLRGKSFLTNDWLAAGFAVNFFIFLSLPAFFALFFSFSLHASLSNNLYRKKKLYPAICLSAPACLLDCLASWLYSCLSVAMSVSRSQAVCPQSGEGSKEMGHFKAHVRQRERERKEKKRWKISILFLFHLLPILSPY